MKRAFRFKLARVARVRELFEETARAELSAALAAMHATEDRLDALRAEVQRGRASQAAAQVHRQLDVRAHLARHEALSRLLEAVVATEAERARLAGVAEQLRLVWQERRAEKEALARLAQRHREQHQAELAKAELAELDEVAIQRAARRRSSSPPEVATDKR